MKVSELIAELAKMPSDAVVLTSGYEGGMDTTTGPVRVRAAQKEEEPGCGFLFGDHERLADDGDPTDGVINAVLIGRMHYDNG